MTDVHRSSEPLARHMTVAPDAARIERQWAAVSSRIAARPLGVRPRVAGYALVAAALALTFVVGRRSAPGLAPSELRLACETAGQVVELPGVGSLECVEHGRSEIVWSAERVSVKVDAGAVTFDVPPGTGRAWSVVAGAFEVRVVGTRFTVRREVGDGTGDPAPERIGVSVERGHVEVVSRDRMAVVQSLHAGESWASAPPPAPTPTAAATSSAAASPAANDAVPAESASPVGTEPPPARPSWEELARAKKPREAWDALGSDGFARALESAGAEKLFRLAEVARAAGHLKEAARAFDAVRRRHRGDARAALAAFELGRMRQDAFGDAGGAAEALGDAMVLAPNAPFREDAEARRVAALDASGARGACRAAREAYLSRWPSGAHAAMVRARCAP